MSQNTQGASMRLVWLLLWVLIGFLVALSSHAATTGQLIVVYPAASGSSTVLDLADDGTDESDDLLEIATTGDTNAIATSPSADKLLLDFSQPWILADQSTSLAANGANCPAGQYPLGVDALGAVEGCTADDTGTDDQVATEVPYTPTTPGDWTDPDPTEVGGALDTLAARDVTADDLSDDSILDLSDVTAISGNTATLATTSGTLTNGNCVEIDVSGNLVDAGAGCGGAAVSFADLTSGTNTTAAMVVGTGASLKVSGSGKIDASAIDANGDGTPELSSDGSDISIPSGDLHIGAPPSGFEAYEFTVNSSNGGIVLNRGGTSSQAFVLLMNNASTSNGGQVRSIVGGGLIFARGSGGEWARISDSGLDTERLLVDEVVLSPSVATCASSGDASPGSLFISATTSYAEVTNSDPDGCTVTIGEPTGGGQHLTLALVATAGGVITLTDTPGTVNISGDWTPGVGDTLSMIYSQTRSEWLQTGSSDN